MRKSWVFQGEFFRTKDIVSMMTGPNTYGRLDAGVKMIDKVNGPFSVAGGKLVATGLVERAIEGEFFNAPPPGGAIVFNSFALIHPGPFLPTLNRKASRT